MICSLLFLPDPSRSTKLTDYVLTTGGPLGAAHQVNQDVDRHRMRPHEQGNDLLGHT